MNCKKQNTKYEKNIKLNGKKYTYKNYIRGNLFSKIRETHLYFYSPNGSVQNYR